MRRKIVFILIIVLIAFYALATINIKPVKAQADHLLINEFGVQPTDDELVELYNPTGSAIDLANWVLSDGEADLTLSGTIDAGGYEVVDVNPPLALANYHDNLYLYDPDDNLVDSVAYGKLGGCPDPEYGWTAARAPNGVDTDDDSADWTVDTTPTMGSANNAPPPNLGGVDVVINEVLPNNASGEEEFVELYNRGASAVDIGGWVITDGEDAYTIPSGTTIPAGGFWVLRGSTWVAQAPFFDDLYNSGDNVYLFTDSWVKVDQIGWSTDPGVGKAIGRVPDGAGGNFAYNDETLDECGWEFLVDENGTPGSANAPVGRTEIEMQLEAPVTEVKVNEFVEVNVTIKNTGTKIANNIGITITVNATGLTLTEGSTVTTIDTLDPNAQQVLSYKLKGQIAGNYKITVKVKGDNFDPSEDSLSVLVEEPSKPLLEPWMIVTIVTAVLAIALGSLFYLYRRRTQAITKPS